MKSVRDQLLTVYALASGGSQDAYVWLLAWHGWCHAIDDHVDEPGRPASDVIDLCAEGAVLFSAGFYRAHAEALGPLIGVVAEEYRASLTAPRLLADALRIAGNHVVLAVAYITGGRPLVRRVSESLWPIVQMTQLERTADAVQPAN